LKVLNLQEYANIDILINPKLYYMLDDVRGTALKYMSALMQDWILGLEGDQKLRYWDILEASILSDNPTKLRKYMESLHRVLTTRPRERSPPAPRKKHPEKRRGRRRK
jgi:hypothetical protein